MRKDHPSIFLFRRFQLDRGPTTTLKQVLPSRTIQEAIAQRVWPDEVINHSAMSILVLSQGVGRKYIR